ncbi:MULTISPECIES: hypothetical protein [unclassified Aureimonas]|uniref:hypothetical protein n=1 Tax=unclassified Aureimonas TaxID=2615206 RepID=UPI0006F71A1D|nr:MULTISPECIES: hypothetical protein [unclassified Aureimonas]KQT65761.1 hypothetical protein ASG62_21555 [Aureimonas sp. Leaf427]KQT74761.1 hypothetical protein ASG54_16615 [Aureimonas sp. Leaf460]
MTKPDSQTRDTLWTLILTPTVWALHFLLSYVFAAFQCAPNEAIFETIEASRLAIAGLTAIALVVIAYVGLRSFREWRVNEGSFPHAGDTAEERERFLEFSSVLLAGLSFIGVLFVALPALLFADCR